MGMTIKVSIYVVRARFRRLLWMAIKKVVVPGAGIEPHPKLLIIFINNCSSLLPRPSEKPLTR